MDGLRVYLVGCIQVLGCAVYGSARGDECLLSLKECHCGQEVGLCIVEVVL